MPSAVRAWIDGHRIVSFLAITYVFTWAIQGLLAVSGIRASWTMSILVGFGAFGPPVGAAVVVWAAGGSLRSWVGQFFHWRIGRRWWAAALLTPLVVLVLGSAIYVALGGPVDLASLPFPGIYLFVMAWGTIWGGGQEELGWRGFLVPMLQERYSALVTSLLVGAAWAGWHLPLFLNANTTHGSWPVSQQLIWGGTILAGSILWTWMYNNTGSVLAAAVFHAGMNSIGVFHPADKQALVPGGIPDPWLNFLAEVSSAVVLVGLAAVVVVAFGTERLSNRDVPDTGVLGLDDGESPLTSAPGGTRSAGRDQQ
ncbi:CPBP family intramembrane metalloprotease [Halobellus sp. Atlit-31R]|nr:CPBP family intramembrane metalloprotease [Halobellus sp. Atlit-31R]